MLSLFETITFEIQIPFDSEKYFKSLLIDHDLNVTFLTFKTIFDDILMTIECEATVYYEICDILSEDDMITAKIRRNL